MSSDRRGPSIVSAPQAARPRLRLVARAGLRGDRVDDRARIVHDTLEQAGWSVEIADAQKVKGLAPLACKTDRIDSMVLAVLSQRDLVPAIWLPDPRVREERELARFRLHLVKHKSALKNRVQSTLINSASPAPSPTSSGSKAGSCSSVCGTSKCRHFFATFLLRHAPDRCSEPRRADNPPFGVSPATAASCGRQ
jgi:hypothetical protein